MRRVAHEGQMSRPLQEASWDGRDDLGSRVASGVYHVQLHEGEYLATKKIILLK